MSAETKSPHDAKVRDLLEKVLDDQKARWDCGEHVLVEDLLSRVPELRDDPEAILDLIYQEYVLRRQLGESFDPNELIGRYPDLAGPIMIQLGIDAAVPTTFKLPEDRNPPVQAGIAAPDRIGDHEVLAVLGRGGMGVVYQARHAKLGRLVAIKMMLEGRYADSKHRDRFRTEAQAAARLRHPNIIAIDAVGEQEERPYLLLEFVGGGSLAQRLAEKPMAPRDAAGLVEILARAVRVAHEAGVVHRDLKPSNILFTTDGVPKVSDFGLAKLLDFESGRTLTGQVVGTPSYMPPEQAEGHGKQVDRRADVYALGAILYQTLVGRPPFLGESALETLKLVTSADVVPPRRLRPDVPRDLETICLKCLEKEPAKRYGSALLLAEDLHRFLDGRPTIARPPQVWEQSWRWCRRNPWAAAFLVALVFGVIGLGTTVGMQLRANRLLKEANGATEAALHDAEESRKQAEEVSTFLVDAFRRPDPAHDGRQVKVIDLLDQARDKLNQSPTGTPMIKGALLDALGRTYSGLGLYDQALAMHTEALAVRTAALGPNHRDTLNSANNLANSYADVGRSREALALHEETCARLESTLGPNHIETLRSRSNLGTAYLALGRAEEAIALHKETLETRESILGPDHPDTLASRGNLAVAYGAAGRLDKKLALNETTLPLMKAKLGPEHPDTLMLAVNLALSYREAGRPADALALDESMLALRNAKLGPNHPETLKSRNNVALDLLVLGRLSEAIVLHETTHKLLEAKLGPDHTDTILSRANLAALYEEAGRLAEAIALNKAILASIKPVFGQKSEFTLAIRSNLASAYGLAGRLSEAMDLMESTLKLMDTNLGPDHRYTLDTREKLARTYKSLGWWSEAEAILVDVTAGWRKTDTFNSVPLAGSLTELGEVLLSRKRWLEAEPLLREALTIRTKTMPDTWEHREAMSLLGADLLGQGRYAEAERPIVEGYEGMKTYEARIPVPYRSRLLAAAMRVVQLYEAWNKPDQADAWKVKLDLPDLPADAFAQPKASAHVMRNK